jgi:Ricin-type beta-trefoil lectin domain
METQTENQDANKDSLVRNRKLSPKFIVPIVIICIVLGYTGYLLATHAASANVMINFNNPITSLDPNAFSGTISTYGGQNITASQKQDTNLKNLNLGLYRVPIQWNGGNPISSAGGGPANISAAKWIQAIKSIGAQPEIVVGGTSDDNFSASDAANLVDYFNNPKSSHYNPVKYWLLGNEPDNHGMSLTANNAYCNLYNSAESQMRLKLQQDGLNPASIMIGGPTIEQWSPAELQNFINCANDFEIIDYHQYAMGGNLLTNAQALTQADSYGSELTQLRSMLVSKFGAAKANSIQMSVGEYNWSWQFGDGYNGADAWDGSGNDIRFFEPVATVWSALVAGNAAAAGGRSDQYSDQNGALGITFDDAEANILSHYHTAVNDPMPDYWGLAMFTGANLFRHFGMSLVQSSTTLPNVEVYSSSNSDNVVLVNKDPNAQQTAILQLTGVNSGTAEVWQTSNSQTAAFSPPKKLQASLTIANGTAQVVLPPYTVTTLVINPTSITNSPTPSPTPSANPTPSQTPTPKPTPSPTPTPAVTPTPTACEPATNAITDAGGNQWWVSGGQVYENCKLAGFSAQVIDLVKVNNVIYQENSSFKWWDWNGTTWVATGSPIPSSTPTPTLVPTPTATPTPTTLGTGVITGIGGKCIDNNHSQKVNGNKIQLYTCNHTGAQQWTMNTSGVTAIKNSNGFCLDVLHSGTAPGTVVQLYQCNGTGAQQWVISPATGLIINVHSGLCLDDRYSNTSDGNQIQVYTCNGTQAQKWTVPF